MNEDSMINDQEPEDTQPTLPQQLELLRQALEGFLKKFSKKTTLPEIVYDLNNQYDILTETLATLSNWLSLHKDIIRTLGVMEKLTEPGMLSQPEDDVKKTIRTGLLPQSGSIVRDVVAGIRGSSKIMDLVNKDLADLDSKIKLLRDFDERFLKIIEYESTLSDGLLSEILNNIYSGFYDSSADKLFSLLNNVKEFTEEKSEE